MKTIALVDTHMEGHHPMFFRIIAKALLTLGNEVLAFCPDPEGFSFWLRQNCPGYEGKTYAFRLDEPQKSRFPIKILRPLFTAVKRWKVAARAIRAAENKTGKTPTLVFFAWFDSYLCPALMPGVIDRIFGYNWAGLYFHPRHLRVPFRFSALKKGFLDYDVLLGSSHCRFVAVLDEGINDKLRRKLKTKTVITFPDITDEAPPGNSYPVTRQILAKARGRKIIGLLGPLTKRKGLLKFLELAQITAGESWFFVTCGRYHAPDFSQKERFFIDGLATSTGSNCFFHPETIPDEASFNSLVSICDVLYAVYEDFYHSSNILTKAALFKKPVIVGRCYCMDERVSRYQLGLSVDIGDIGQYHRAIKDILSGAAGLKPDYESFLSQHSEERLKQMLNEGMKSI